jgi:hypothetical protein
MRKFLKSIIAPFAWFDDVVPGLPHHVIQANAVTGEQRWQRYEGKFIRSRHWYPGVPPSYSANSNSDAAPSHAPSGGSSGEMPVFAPLEFGKPPSGGPIEVTVKDPQAFDRLREAMARASKEGMILEPGMKVETGRPRLAITPAPKGGYVIGREDRSFGSPVFKTLYAGDLSDCLNFIESEMEAGA